MLACVLTLGCIYPACGAGPDSSGGSADANDSGGSAGPGGFDGSSGSDQKAVLPVSTLQPAVKVDSTLMLS